MFRFSDLSSDQRSVAKNRGSNSVKDGSSVGFDIPGVNSPVDYLKSQRGPKFSSLELSPAIIDSEDPVICEVSTGLIRKEERLDSDSAFQEPMVTGSSTRNTFNSINFRLLQRIMILGHWIIRRWNMNNIHQSVGSRTNTSF